ncbi:HDOD domain-containing protein [Desulfurivibrio alkaliphilus]|uniref:Metal dependent phosphohydrolase n=1 Tax=Desulfurivibrio alkaliphilus (strain DSM 19089 / UNIQEM U267 / AHT2) TaxID=589865 RepID=D6Z3B4_DESAT|nr:HDOD domain-containing protein [Desulfurivibrio alkaliphilus]ADH86039.1 metal dependent phosphohydrolase [Desulfurivibrio alkaliphilus AHT 2]
MNISQQIVSKFTATKTLPHVALKVNQLVRDERATMHDFEEVIRLDPVLVTRLLRLVNSPYFGLAKKVESISKAVVFCGFKQLRNLVAVEALRGMFKGDGERFSREKLWLHSATVAILAEMIAKRIFGLEGEDVFLAGIIHDVGLVAEDQVAGEELRLAADATRRGEGSLVASERRYLGTDHCEIGALLAKEWKLGDEVLKSIRYHHDERKSFTLPSVPAIMVLADFMAFKMQYNPVPGVPVPSLPPALARHVKSMMANYKIIVRDLPEEMEKAKELYRIDD